MFSVRKMKIKGKMIFGYALVIFLMILMSILSIIGLTFVNQKMQAYLDGAQKADTAVKMCRINTDDAARNIREMVLNTDTSTYSEYKKIIQANIDELYVQLDILKSANVLDNSIYDRYESTIKNWITIGNEIVSEMDNNNKSGATKMVFDKCVPALKAVVDAEEEINSITEKLKTKSISLAENTVAFDVIAILLALILAIICAFVVGTKIIKSILIPLKEIENVADEMSHGNLHIDIKYSENNEIGDVANSFRKSISILQSYIDDLGKAMGAFSAGNFDVVASADWKGDFINIKDSIDDFQYKMADIVANIKNVAEQVSSASEQISISSNELAVGVGEQAEVTENLAGTIKELSENIKQNADNANAINRDVQYVGIQIDNSNDKMQQMVRSMKEINESSQEISKIIAAIHDIASQTNLLALNASIEAARAGEAGKGFAVVADQVSILADQSAQAAKESTMLIESSVKAVENGMVIANETAEKLNGVVDGSKAIMEKVNEIANASEAQASSISQIKDGVDQINGVVQVNSATSEECAASSEEMTGQSEVLRELIRELKVKKI